MCVLILAFRRVAANVRLQAEVDELNKQLAEAIQRLAQSETEPRSRTSTKMVDLLAAAGIPGLLLLAAIAIYGFSGVAAITVVLSSLGGPPGCWAVSVYSLLLSVQIAKYGVADVSTAVVR